MDYNHLMFAYLLQGLTLGLAAGAQPGPFQTYLVSQSLRNGWRRTWVAAFAPLVSDGPIVALTLIVLSRVPDWFQHGLRVAGGMFVLYLAWGAFRAWRAPGPDTSSPAGAATRSLLQAATMNALSPGPYLFWSLVIGPLILSAWRDDPLDAGAVVVSFYIAMIALNTSIVVLFGQAARLGEQVRRGMLGFSALALAAFGLYQVWAGLFP